MKKTKKSHPFKSKYSQPSKEDIALAISWAKDEVSGVQLSHLWKVKNGGAVINKVVMCLRQYFRNLN